MIELINILFSSILIFSFLLIPVINLDYLIDNKYKKLSNPFVFVAINFIIHAFVLFFLSFLNLKNIIYIYSLTFVFITFIFNKKNLLKIIKENLHFMILFYFLFVCLNIILAEEAKLNWDGLTHWFFKYLNFDQNINIRNLNNLPMSNYPHLGPYLWNFYSKFSFMDFEYTGRFIYNFSLMLPIFLHFKNLNLNNIILSLFIYFLIYLNFDLFLVSGYQEYLTFFFISSSVYFLFDENLKVRPKVILIFLCLFILPWIKREGTIFSLIFLFAVLLSNLLKKNEKISLTILCFIGLILFFTLKIIFFDNLKIDNNYNVKDILNVLVNESNIFLFLKTFFIELIISILKYPIWILIIISLIYMNINKVTGYKYFNIIAGCLLISFILIYILPEGNKYIKQTLDRLLLQSSSFFLIPIFQLFKFFFGNLEQIYIKEK